MKTNLMIGAVLVAAMTLSARHSLAADGKALYEQSCAKCHGVDAKGNTKMGQKLGIKDLSNPKSWEGLTDAAAVKAIKEGVKDKNGRMVMKADEGVSDADARAMVEYMKSLKK